MNRPNRPRSLQKELKLWGIIITDMAALWREAKALGQPTRWARPVFQALRDRYAQDGTPIRTYAEIAELWKQSRQSVQPVIKRAVNRLARPEHVIRYGHYLQEAEIAQQLQLDEAEKRG